MKFERSAARKKGIVCPSSQLPERHRGKKSGRTDRKKRRCLPRGFLGIKRFGGREKICGKEKNIEGEYRKKEAEKGDQRKFSALELEKRRTECYRRKRGFGGGGEQ